MVTNLWVNLYINFIKCIRADFIYRISKSFKVSIKKYGKKKIFFFINNYNYKSFRDIVEFRKFLISKISLLLEKRFNLFFDNKIFKFNNIENFLKFLDKTNFVHYRNKSNLIGKS